MLLIADLDGTAIDTKGLILASYRYVIDTFGLPPRSEEELEKCLGVPLKKLYPQWAAEEVYPKMFDAHRKFQANNLDLVKVFPGIPEAFAELRAKGVRIGINTNRSVTGREFIRLTGLDSLVDHIVTFEDVSQPKPAPEGILMAMRFFKCGPDCTWMMGDTDIDIEAGRNALIPTIGVDFSSGCSFGDSTPDYIIRSPAEIVPILLP